jgi:hypothetical protein
MSSAPPQAADRVRPSTVDDYAGVSALWETSAFWEIKQQDYTRRWSDNPFRVERDEDGRVITGWVIESANARIVGTIGNIYLGYELNGQPLLAAEAHASNVLPEHRRSSLSLWARYFAQKPADLLLGTTANSTAGRVYEGFKAKRMPRRDYDQVLYWITGYAGFITSALRRRNRAAGAIAPLGAPALWLGDLKRRAHRPARDSRLHVHRAFDPRFDQLWLTVRQRRDVLLAVRSTAALAWHFREAGEQNRLGIVTLEEGSTLAGYAILARRDAPELGLRRYQLADLQVARREARDVDALIRGAIDLCRADRVHVLEAVGFDTFKHEALQRSGVRQRTSPTFPFYYKAQSPVVAEQLARPEFWDPCPYDGDAAF